MEEILKKDGWVRKTVKGSHYQYTHPEKPGKVTLPRHGGDLDIRTANSILRQAGLK